MRRSRRTTAMITATAAAALLLGSCTMSTSGKAPADSAISVPDQPAASGDAGLGTGTAGTASNDDADAQMLRDSGSWAAGSDLCSAVAKGPWTEVTPTNDPVALVQAGTVPAGLDLDAGLGEAPDEVNSWTKASEYHDPSTLDDPGAIVDAMERAGFASGAEAVWHNGDEGATITAVRFRDAASAQAVLSALATDYCTRAVSSRALPDGTGMDIVRDSGATRVLAVLGDTVISVWACSCISSRTDDGISTWHDQFRALIDAPKPDTSAS